MKNSALVSALAICIVPACVFAQQAVTANAPVVPSTIRYSASVAADTTPGTSIHFALYAEQQGGEPIWSEDQPVSPDTAGKFSVLLGAVTPGGVPAAVFAGGAPRWIGITLPGQQESARTPVVSVPYAMKSQDAEKLGGHSADEFLLKDAAATNITQINVGSGLTGGGTGPTVTLGLSTSYLQSIGNAVYAQLAAANTFSGNQTIKGNLTVSGTVSGSNLITSITGTNGVSVSNSGSAYTIGLNDSTLQSLGNSLYAQLGSNNTYSGSQTFNGAITQNYAGAFGFGTVIDATGTDSIALSASSVNTGVLANSSNGFGVNAIGALGGVETTGTYYGVYANTTETGSGYFSTGVYGNTPSPTGFGVAGYAPAGTNDVGVYGQLGEGSLQGNGAYSGAAVRGDSTNNTSSGFYVGVLGTAADSEAGAFVNNSPTGYTTLYVVANNAQSSPFITYNSASGGSCIALANGDFNCTGTVGASIVTADQRTIATYGVRASEDWLEDFGSATLTGGRASVALAADFAQVANTEVEYHVFLTPEGDSKGLYVVNRTAGGFEVREQGGGAASIPFSYRVVARPLHSAAVRLADRTAQVDKMQRELGVGRYARPLNPQLHPATRIPMPTLKTPHTPAKAVAVTSKR